jgi:AraC-like DNA-binding protein/predicted transcriptional regulator YdeE
MESNADLVREVMAWAGERLGGDLDVPILAARAGYSVHHFSRLFSAVAGLPPAEWVQRERVFRAAGLLSGTGLRVVDVALECGFKDAATFSRAFRRVVGSSPMAWREGRGDPRGLVMGNASGPRLIPGGLVASTRIDYLPSADLVGLSGEVRGPGDSGLPARLWARLQPEAKAAGILPEGASFIQLAFWEEEAEERFTCIAGFCVSRALPPPLPFVAVSIPPERALIFTVPGPPERIGPAYEEIYGSILPASTERPALRFALELYPADSVTEICFPLASPR